VSYDDPGWRRAWFALLPPWHGLVSVVRGGADGITSARILFFAFMSSPLFMGAVLPLIVDETNGANDWSLIVPVALGAGGIAAALWVRRHHFLLGTEPRHVAMQYQQQMILGIAFAELPALVSWVVCFLLSARWPYVIGLAFSLTGMALVAPTRSDIDRKQQQLRERGSANLGQALLDNGPTRRGWRGAG
jgi:hypothetical protein